MDFPFYEIQLQPRKLKSGKHKARCSISEHTGDKVHVIQPRWELSGEYESENAANKAMKFNAIQFLKREYGFEDLNQVKITQV